MQLLGNQVAHDSIGPYNQDRINGFSDAFLNRFLDVADLKNASSVLDLMGGNGNLVLRMYRYCQEHHFNAPEITLIDHSQVQCNFAKYILDAIPSHILCGDVFEMLSPLNEEPIRENSFDRIIIKSGSHEIPLEKQAKLYQTIFRALRPGGLFINLGFLFDNLEERQEFQRITWLKDKLSGMQSAVTNRHFLLREELYPRLENAGFTNLRCAMHFDYRISSRVLEKEYFQKLGIEGAHEEFLAAQARAIQLRRNGKIRFEGDASIMLGPGEITVARKPSPMDGLQLLPFTHSWEALRYLPEHSLLLIEAVGHIPPGSSVLELGSGCGLLAEKLLGQGVNYLGIESTDELVDLCRQKFQNRSGFRFEKIDFRKLEIGTRRFENILALNTLHLAGANPCPVLKKLHEALVPGGKLILSLPKTEKSWSQISEKMARDLLKLGFFKNLESLEATMESFFSRHPEEGSICWSPEGMERLLREEIGFSEVRRVDTEVYSGFFYFLTACK